MLPDIIACFDIFLQSLYYWFIRDACGIIENITYEKCLVAGVVSKLNSPTGTPRCATCGANIAAGYTTEDVPMTKQASQFSTAASSSLK